MSAHLRDFDDVDGILAADREGILRGAATAGAHVRAVAQAQSEGVLAPLADSRPRSLILVTGASATARRAASLITALLAAHIDVPIVTAPSLPGWIGPLDVVVLAGDDPGDREYADAALRALRRRAELVTAVAVQGPLADAIGTEACLDLSPRLPLDPRFGFARLAAVFVAVCTALQAVRIRPNPPALADVADALDAEAAAAHPTNETFHNEAKQLAMRLDGRTVVWSGDTSATVAVAEHASASAFSVAGIASAVADEPTALTRIRDGIRSGGAAVDSIFYDPDFDPAPPAGAPRVLLLATAVREWGARTRVGSLPDVDVVTELSSNQPRDPEPSGGADRAADSPTDLTACLILAVRADLAAAYLELTGATAR